MKKCIICGFHKLSPVFISQSLPLRSLGLPKNEKEAKETLKLPLEFFCCNKCTHIFNVSFSYNLVPYKQDSNLMYNQGSGWNNYLDKLANKIYEHKTLDNALILEIGCGDCNFLKRINTVFPNSRCIGYDPSNDDIKSENIKKVSDYFIPERDLKIKPDIIIIRHVLEHLEDPVLFLSEIAFWCSKYNHYPLFVLEVPRMDEAIKQKRVNDFTYEHVSNFTDRSFSFLLQLSGFKIEYFASEYNKEVILTFARPKFGDFDFVSKDSIEYQKSIDTERKNVIEFFYSINPKTTVFWGATGRGATFFNAFDITNDKFSLVVDSDIRKHGFYVPGTGQLIQNPDILLQNNVDNIIVTTAWRVKDIYEEILLKKIPHKNVFFLKENQMSSYL